MIMLEVQHNLYDFFFFLAKASFYMIGVVLLWLLAAICMKNGQPQIARRAIELAETRLLRDNRPKRFIWKRARKLPTWSIARYFVAKMMLEDVLGMVSQDEDEQIKAPLRRSNSCRF